MFVEQPVHERRRGSLSLLVKNLNWFSLFEKLKIEFPYNPVIPLLRARKHKDKGHNHNREG